MEENREIPPGKGLPGGDPDSGSPPAAALAFNKANSAFRKGDWNKALAWSTRALEADEQLAIAAVLQARSLNKLERWEEAREAYSGALRLDPERFSAWLELGNVCRHLGTIDRAIHCYEKAIGCRPFDARGHLAAARVLEERQTERDADRAAYHYHRAVTCAGGRERESHKAAAAIHHRMGCFRLERGAAHQGLEALRQALMAARLAPSDFSVDELAEIKIDLADCLLRLGLADDAHQLLAHASRAEGEPALTRLADVAYRFNLWAEAVGVLRRNAELHPVSGAARLNLADMLVKSWQIEEALAELDKAAEIGRVPDARITTLRATIAGRMGDADSARSLYRQLVDSGAETLRSSAAMSALYSDSLTPEQVADLHRELFAPFGASARPVSSFKNNPSRDRPLRIGMVTADLHHQHPVNIFLQPMLARWNNEHFPLTVYFTGRTYDKETHLAKSRVLNWRESSPERLARQVDEDRIDILIDLAGHTSQKNMELFAKRLAPVQATFLGYPGSTGVPNIDWIFGDIVVTPPQFGHLYSEQVARLPETVFCYAPETDYPSPSFDAASAARPLTFGSFNNIPKLTPHTIELWAGVLDAVPESRLLLKAPSFRDAGAVERYQRLFAGHGIAPGRLEFRGPSGLSKMMSEYGEVDICLDPVPYNGGTTTLQALWMGAPVIVMEGRNFAARMGASFLRAAGLPEWVALDDTGYIEAARRKAADRMALLDLKRTLRRRLLARPGWDIRHYMCAFEARLAEMWPPGRQRI